jgi:hypothetical protein
LGKQKCNLIVLWWIFLKARKHTRTRISGAPSWQDREHEVYVCSVLVVKNIHKLFLFLFLRICALGLVSLTAADTQCTSMMKLRESSCRICARETRET